jgi:hypothetical protein
MLAGSVTNCSPSPRPTKGLCTARWDHTEEQIERLKIERLKTIFQQPGGKTRTGRAMSIEEMLADGRMIGAAKGDSKILRHSMRPLWLPGTIPHMIRPDREPRPL